MGKIANVPGVGAGAGQKKEKITIDDYRKRGNLITSTKRNIEIKNKMSKYILNHYAPNPRLNSSEHFSTKKAALTALREYPVDEDESGGNAGTMTVECAGVTIARRDYTERRITLFKTQKQNEHQI